MRSRRLSRFDSRTRIHALTRFGLFLSLAGFKVKRGTLVELSAYGRNLKWLVYSYNEQAFSKYAIVVDSVEATGNIQVVFHRLIDGKVFKRVLPRKCFRKAKVIK